jgi:hypothetical protein
MYAATQTAFRTLSTPVRFVGNAAGQALERIIPHGASEVGQALYGGGSAYAPPGVTERLTQEQGNVHGTAPAQVAQAQRTQSVAAVRPPSQQPTQAHTASTYMHTPQPVQPVEHPGSMSTYITAASQHAHEQTIQKASNRAAFKAQNTGRSR